MNVADCVFAMLARGEVFGPLGSQLLTDDTRFRLFAAPELVTAAAAARSLDIDGRTMRPGAIGNGRMVLLDGNPWRVANLGRERALLVPATRAQVNDGGVPHLELPIDDFWAKVADGQIQPTADREDGLPEEVQALLAACEDLTRPAERARVVVAYRDRPRSHRRANRPAGPRNVFMGHPLRTVQSWTSQYEEAERKWGLGILGLIDKANPGNRGDRLDATTCTMINAVIDEELLTARAPIPTRVHGELLRRLKEAGIEQPVAFEAFKRRFDQRLAVTVVEAREGHRAAYALTEQFYAGTSPFPVHGLYPWHIVHLDSTILPIELLDLTGRSLGKPWMHVAVDAYTRRVLAVVLTFEAPSHRSTSLVIDEMVSRFRRVPDFITHDQGKEFENAHVRLTCAALGISDKVRPAAKPRYGSIIERLIGSLQTWLVVNLSGNAKIEVDHFRQKTKSVDPVEHRAWDLLSLHYAIQGVAYELYDERQHPTTLMSPRERYDRGIELAGTRPMRTIPYDEALRMTLLPLATRGGERFVDPDHGVKIGEVHYRHPLFSRHPVFRRKGVNRKPCRVKPDPYDARRIFVYVPVPHPDRPYSQGHWVIATASLEGLGLVGRLTCREVAAESAVFRRRKHLQHGSDRDYEVALATFIKSREALMHRVKAAAQADAERAVRERRPAHADPDLRPVKVTVHRMPSSRSASPGAEPASPAGHRAPKSAPMEWSL